ncbi:2-oxo acid dehydrogenase subunit E2 [Dactylosporangium sp. NBC_01737]|uniref:2-oxo acid dehydrogenase subunit E2 n=1 Tax=Dactylosporangium sp. NBC_01737 TaxID=2975959 RepID=UPI002E14E8B3|nr:2-oxo acid dehydrogenase subunit E2 [Dactylosporangium sp. NBC_01737]
MREIRLPKLNSNDVAYTLVEWYGHDGGHVAEGAVVALVETSKTAEDLTAPAGGILHRTVGAPAECAHGDVVGYLFESDAERTAFLAAPPHDTAHGVTGSHPGLIVTEPARVLIEQAGVDPARLAGLGRTVIRRSDVLALLTEQRPAGGTSHPLTRQQRSVADVVTRSHLSIPAAYTAIRVDATRVAALRRQLPAAAGRTVGTVELLVKAVAGLRDRYPLCFGAYQDDASVLVPDGAHVAVTVDAGEGLYLPVVRHAGELSHAQIGDVLAAFTGKARHGTFRADELTGANIGLSLTNYTDVLFTQPIIPPGTSCMLTLSGTHRDAVVAADGTVVARSWFALGLAYDHRVVNGRDAVVFLRDVKRALERAAGAVGPVKA